MKAANPNQTFNYVPECDKDLPAGEQTIFVLRALKPKEEKLVDNLIAFGDTGTNLRLGDQVEIALSCGIVDVQNFFDEKGNPVKVFRESGKVSGIYQPLSDKFLELIPKEIRSELSRVIIDGSELGDEEAKH